MYPLSKRKGEDRSVMASHCMNRYTTEKDGIFFKDRIHKFYIERRCENTPIEGKNICSECILQYMTKRQYSRRYPHGRINEPIPSHSHLFGGEWYTSHVDHYGEPSSECILYAIRCQEEARDEGEEKERYLSKDESLSSLNKKKKLSFPKNMPRPKKNAVVVEQPVSIPPVSIPPVSDFTISTEIPDVKTKIKRVRKPRVANKLSPMAPVRSDSSPPSDDSPPSEESSTYPPSNSLPVLTMFQKAKEEKELEKSQEAQEAKEEETPKTKKVVRTKKPKRSESKEEEEKTKEIKEKPKRKAPIKKKDSIVIHPPPIVHKDSCIPTHLEETIEEHALDDYETEYVSLTIFILDEVVYFRDAKKNKLYRRIKEKTIGQYVGRYDPTTDSLVTDIPDSDDEE